MTEHVHSHPVAHKAEHAPKPKSAPEPQKFSLIEYADNKALAVENGDWTDKKQDGRATPPRACSLLGVYLSFDEGHKELIRLRDEREAQIQKDHQDEKAKKAKEAKEVK